MFHNEEWEPGTKESLCNITSNDTKGNTSSSPKKANWTTDGTCSYFTMKIYELTVAFFLGTQFHISGPTRQWIECASNFPAVRTGSSRGNPHINGIINTSIGSFRKMFFSEYFSGRMRRKVAGSWQTSNTKKSFEGCLIIKKNSRTKCKLPCRLFRTRCIPVSFAENRVSWVVAFDLKFV